MIETLRNNIRLVALIIVIIALIVVNVMLFMPMKDAQAERDKLAKEEKSKTAQLQSLQQEQNLDALRQEIEELEDSIIHFEEEFPMDQFGIYLAKGAETYHILLQSITPPTKAGSVKIGGKGFPVWDTRITIQGELHYILSYFKYVEEGRYNSIETSNLSLSAKGDVWSASFTISFITWS